MDGNPWLIAAGALDAGAALLHVGCIVGGARWYRFFGAGERLVRLAERGSPRPAIYTTGIAAMLGIWAAYAWSGPGLIAPLPLLRPVLIAIAAIYLVRAAALPVMIATMRDRSRAFLVWSSAIVFVLGIVHAVGIVTGWTALG